MILLLQAQGDQELCPEPDTLPHWNYQETFATSLRPTGYIIVTTSFTVRGGLTGCSATGTEGSAAKPTIISKCGGMVSRATSFEDLRDNKQGQRTIR